VAEKAVQGDQFFEEKSSAGENEYLYNGKELQEELGQYDYGARFYDPVIARFTTIDPVAEHFPWLTSYQYGSNNPSSKKDLDGLEGIFFQFDFFFEESALIPKSSTSGAGYSAENIARAGGDVAKGGVEEGAKPTEGHHVIPRALKNNDFVKDSRQGGFEFEGKENKVGLDKFNKASGEGEHGNHPKYTSELEKKIDALKEKNADASPGEKANLLRNVVKDVKELINNSKGIKTNDLFKPAAQDATKVVIPIIQPPKPPPPPPPCPTCS
jgi:RHS repeat-associated protein